MKKLFVLALVLMVSVASFANNDEATATNSQKSETTNKTLCNPNNFSHWSIAVGGGANLMLAEGTVDNLGNSFGTYLKQNVNWAVKGEVEYMVNPVWGLNLQYMYDPYRKTRANAIGYTTDRDLGLHEMTLRFMFNILNIGRRTRNHTNWNWDAGLGAGVLLFQRAASTNYDYRPAGMIVASTSVEYSPVAGLGIFAEGQFRWYADDRINGVQGGQLKDCGLYGGLGLRYHIGTTKKPHVRVIDSNTYEPLAVASNDASNKDIKALQSKIDSLQSQISKVNQKPAVKGISDDELNQKIADAVNKNTQGLRGEMNTLNLNINNQKDVALKASDLESVYFATNSNVITAEYQILLAKVARRLLKNSAEKITVTGYCDHVGSVESNKALAQRRIDAIVDLLVSRYKIDKSRISTVCEGRVDNDDDFDVLNRRCDITFSK